MPPPCLTFRNAFLVFLIAWAFIPYPTGLGTQESIASTGLVRTLGHLCNYLGVPEQHRLFGPIYPRIEAAAPSSAEETAETTDRRMRWPFSCVIKQKVTKATTRAASTMASVRTPVYFLSHGGPNIMENITHPAYAQLRGIGIEITQKVKPKAVVVFSAHWQGQRDVVEVNTAESMGLIYDFYGFPAHYYEMKYPNKGSPALADRLLKMLGEAGIKAEGVRRGLDHGVWAGFMCAFNPETNPLNVPVVQVSLFDTEDPNQHYKLGQAISSLRDEGIQIICSGMAVHKLRDMWRAMQSPAPMPYAVSFDDALKDAVEQTPEERQRAMSELLKRPDARKAHPSFDHLLPVHIAAGAAGNDSGKQIWTMAEGCVAWGQFRFGEVGA